jgi:CheY-like chemotaxis protein
MKGPGTGSGPSFNPSEYAVMIVDDDPDHLEMLALIAEQGDFRVLTASSCAECLEIISSHPVDAIVCDIVMPGMGGIDFVQQVRAAQRERAEASIPIILVTASRTDLRYEAVFEGANLFCAKKDANELLVRQLRFLMQRKLRR